MEWIRIQGGREREREREREGGRKRDRVPLHTRRTIVVYIWLHKT